MINFLPFHFQSSLLVKDERYPHIVYVEKETSEKFQRRASSLVTDKRIDLEGLLYPLTPLTT